uniref:CapA family protein n=1 Tax=Lachnoclostridium phocaeense TaxID=1871021 RepID=UPI0026DBF56C|nr:CapA family protein [Lachnoclostridium phocaeense]
MKIAFLGDIALFGKNTTETTLYQRKFRFTRNILESCDFVVGNLESPLTTHTKTIGGKSAYLKGNPKDVEILKYLNVTHVSLANNHMFDYGIHGLQETIDTLDRAGIKWFGANGKTAVIRDNINKLSLMGYCCYSTNGKGLGVKKPCINVFNPSAVENEVTEVITNDMLPVLSIHWGEEHVHYPNFDHLEVARKLCKDKKIIIHGHHPHVIQGIEEVSNSIVAYSLGNFCFDDVYTYKSKEPLIRLSKDNMESFILLMEIENNHIINYKPVPFSFREDCYQPDEEILVKLKKWSSFLYANQDEYIKKRSRDLQVYLEGRKKMRNMEWYIKRLNMSSIEMYLSSKLNRKRYNEIVRSYINHK